MERDEFERGVRLLGLVGFENKLKADTLETVLLLNRAHVETKIITGDNIYIGVETALRAGFFPPNSKVVVIQGANQIPQSEAYNVEVLNLAHGLVSSTPLKLNLQ